MTSACGENENKFSGSQGEEQALYEEDSQPEVIYQDRCHFLGRGNSEWFHDITWYKESLNVFTYRENAALSHSPNKTSHTLNLQDLKQNQCVERPFDSGHYVNDKNQTYTSTLVYCLKDRFLTIQHYAYFNGVVPTNVDYSVLQYHCLTENNEHYSPETRK